MYVAFLCRGFRFFCRSNFNSGKVRNKENGLYRSDGGAHGGSPYFFHGLWYSYRVLLVRLLLISSYTFLFLVLSGAATGASWLCYFKALQSGDINKVVPIDKSSTVLTIILALIFLHEGISLPKTVAVIAIAVGILLMIERKDVEETKKTGRGGWFLYAAGSAFFASLTAILGKVGISGVESNLGTAIRTCVVIIMAWGMVFVTGKQREVMRIGKKELAFICLSPVWRQGHHGCVITGALQEGACQHCSTCG